MYVFISKKIHVSIQTLSQKYGVGTQAICDLIKTKDKIIKYCT